MAAEPALLDLIETASSLGFSYAQTLWDTSGTIWKPYLLPFNPRYTYYLWTARQHIAVTLDGQVPITAGDGHWVMHAPYGQYRGWMRGALRSLAQWWLARNYALRDWARYCERHGFPILLADTPFGADPNDVAAYTSQLAGIGQESVLQLPGGPDLQKYGKYDLRYLEPKDENWQAFKALIDQCNDEITLALLGQNLTTQVKEGSFAAARVHADVRQSILEAEARSLAKTIYLQVARPFAALNFGNADYAPTIKWDVSPVEDAGTMAQALSVFSQAVRTLREAGELIDVKRLAKLCNLPYAALKSAHVNEAPIYAYHMTAGVVTANEVRSRLGLPPVDGGDDLLPTAATAATKAADAKAEEVDDEDDKAEAKPSRKETSGAKTLSLAAPGRRSARDRAARA
jgi:phage gp29-like protein